MLIDSFSVMSVFDAFLCLLRVEMADLLSASVNSFSVM